MTTPKNSSPQFNQLDAANAYVRMGLKLAPIPFGLKGPNRKGWNELENLIVDDTQTHRTFGGIQMNMGLHHEASGTVAIDVDDVDRTRIIFDHFGLDYDGMVGKGLRIYSKPNRDKLIFAAPPGLGLEQVHWPKQIPTKPNDVFTVFEMRAGPNQDVLPPSKHPDGHFYHWIEGRAPWDCEDGVLPALPEDVYEFWLAYSNPDGKLKEAVQLVCPWSAKDDRFTRERPRQSAGKGQDIIGKFNAANDIGDMLERCGYKRKGKRFLAPSSSTNIPGVAVFENGRCFSHHGSDLLAGFAHDSFSVFEMVEHQGDRRRALEAAARELGIERDAPISQAEHEAAGALGLEMLAIANAKKGIKAPPPAASAPDDQQCDNVEDEDEKPCLSSENDPVYPEHLKRPPGMVGDIAEYILATAGSPLPMSSVAAALSIVGTALARQVMGPTSGRTNMYFVTLARSGFGKDHPRKCAKEIFYKATLEDDLLNGEEMISAAGFRAAATARPRGLFLIDELGRLLESISHKNVGGHMLDLTTSIMKMFSSSDSVYLGGDKADIKLNPRKPIPYPCVGIYATTVPRSFYENLNSDSISSGFLNRFMVVEEPSARPKRGHVGPRYSPPQEVVEWIQATQKINPQRNPQDITEALADPGAHPVGVEFENSAVADLCEAFRLWCEGRGDSYTGTSKEPMQELWVRAYEYALKIALVLGVGMTRDHATLADARTKHTLKIDLACMQWGIDFAKAMTEHVEKAARTRMGDTEHARLALKVEDALRRAKEAGRTEAELAKFCAAYRGANKQGRQGVIDTLKADGKVKMGQRVDNYGRVVSIFLATKW